MVFLLEGCDEEVSILVVAVVFDVFLECSDVFVGYTGDVGKVEYSCLIKEEVCEGVFHLGSVSLFLLIFLNCPEYPKGDLRDYCVSVGFNAFVPVF